MLAKFLLFFLSLGTQCRNIFNLFKKKANVEIPQKVTEKFRKTPVEPRKSQNPRGFLQKYEFLSTLGRIIKKNLKKNIPNFKVS